MLRAWVFDLDGTLTVASHDYDALRRELGLPRHLGILEGLAALDDEARQAADAQVAAWEARHADEALLAPGAGALLADLRRQGVALGIVTRNRRDVALRTLDVIGLAHLVSEQDVISRQCAPAKPAPDGILRLLERWSVAPRQAAMVGDHLHDLQAGRAAGVHTVLARRDPPAAWAPWADHHVDGLTGLAPAWLPSAPA